MPHFSVLAVLFSFCLPLAAGGAVVPVKIKPPEIKFLSLSAPTKEPIETLLISGDVHLRETTHNVKLSIVFDRPVAVKKIQLDSCSPFDWSDGIEVFSSPGNNRFFIEGGRRSLVTKLNSSGDVEAIAIVFGRNADLCLKGLKFFGAGDVMIPFAALSNTVVKFNGAGGARLFDAHPETLTAIEDPLHLTFSETLTFDRAIVWTGGTALFAHALKLTSEKGWSETLPLRNAVSEQEIIFKKPFVGKELTIQAPDAGEISEMRFALKTKVQSFEHESSTLIADDLKAKFADAGFEKVLDTKWVTSDDDKWTFLFRSDGTFFVHGFNDDTKQAREYSALGSFTLVRQEKNKIRMRINGVRFPTGVAWDGVSCPFACGSERSVDRSTSVVDSVVLEKANEGSIMVRNRTPRPQRTITFGDLRIHRAVDD